MGKFFAGMAVSVILGVAVWGFVLGPRGDESCNERCALGTHCKESRCHADEPEPELEPVAQADTKKKKRKRRGKRKRGGAAGSEAAAGRNSVGWVDDAYVPRFDPRASKTIGENTGSERLSDRAINSELKELDPAFQKCVRNAVERSDEDLPSGRVRYEFGIAPSGKVIGINVRGSAELRAHGIFPCVRVALYKHKFPSFDGLPMGASGSFSI